MDSGRAAAHRKRGTSDVRGRMCESAFDPLAQRHGATIYRSSTGAGLHRYLQRLRLREALYARLGGPWPTKIRLLLRLRLVRYCDDAGTALAYRNEASILTSQMKCRIPCLRERATVDCRQGRRKDADLELLRHHGTMMPPRCDPALVATLPT